MKKKKNNPFNLWLSGFLSGRGCFFAKDFKRGDRTYKQIGLKISSRDPVILDYLKEKLGFGYTTHSGKNYIFWITKQKDLKNLIMMVKDNLFEKEKVEEILELI